MGRSRSRSRERHRSRGDSRERDRDRHRDRDRNHDRDRDRDRDRRRDRDRDAERDRERRDGDKPRHSGAGEPERNGQDDKRRRAESPGADAEAEKKRARLEKLAAWRSKQGGAAGGEAGGEPGAQDAQAQPQEPGQAQAPSQAPAQAQAEPPQQGKPEVWMPWEDPSTAFGAPRGPQLNLPPPEIAAKQLKAAAKQAAELRAAAALVEDPLDAFMAAEVAPEIAAKERAEEERRAEQRRQRLEARAEGKIPKLEAILAIESESEDEPDVTLEIPANKIKLMVGPGGERIKLIQRKSKCRIQVKKEEEELNRAFGSSGATVMGVQKPGAPRPGATAADLAEKKMVTVMLFGNAHECEVAQRMIAEAIDNKEQKAKQRHKEYEKKREAKNRDRQMYILRHTRDYEALELPIGASRAEVKAQYRKLAKVWHPDKHHDNAEEATVRFQAIQRAYDSLMSTDEDARIEALAGK